MNDTAELHEGFDINYLWFLTFTGVYIRLQYHPTSFRDVIAFIDAIQFTYTLPNSFLKQSFMSRILDDPKDVKALINQSFQTEARSIRAQGGNPYHPRGYHPRGLDEHYDLAMEAGMDPCSQQLPWHVFFSTIPSSGPYLTPQTTGESSTYQNYEWSDIYRQVTSTHELGYFSPWYSQVSTKRSFIHSQEKEAWGLDIW